MLLPVILSGGFGSRLWPLSQQTKPKQFIKLLCGDSLLQKCFKRASKFAHYNEIVIVTNRDLFFETKDEIANCNNENIKQTFLLEPVRKNTAAAISIAAQYALSSFGPDCILLILPSDHLIDNFDSFSKAVNLAKNFAMEGKLTTYGIEPSYPETGYGYILANGSKVEKFVEKPNKETAEKYIENGHYLWNSGIFSMRVDSFLSELANYSPDIEMMTKKAFDNAKQSSGQNYEQYEIKLIDYTDIPNISVDYAVFEKSNIVTVVSGDFAWSDIGSWKTLGALYPIDDNQNNVIGNVVCNDTTDCVIYGEHKLIATFGIKDLIISDTANALLVAHKDKAQEIRHIENEFTFRNCATFKKSTVISQKWGSYTVLQDCIDYTLKLIEINICSNYYVTFQHRGFISLTVISGIGMIVSDDDIIEISSMQTISLPFNKIKNIGKHKLTVIEIHYKNNSNS